MPHDLRFALRRLGRAPGTDAVLLRPLSHEQPGRLAGMWEASRFRDTTIGLCGTTVDGVVRPARELGILGRGVVSSP